MKQVVLASGNPGKLREIRPFVKGFFELLPQSIFITAEVDETGLSYVENAILKARHAARHSGLAALADDSGLEVDALDGRPGIHSARYAGSHAADRENIEKLLQELVDVPEQRRTARFVCVMVYVKHASDATPIICQGIWEGRILTESQGHNGFGYDPVFYVPAQHCSAAELPTEAKMTLSHRGQALRALSAMLQLKD